MVLGPRLTAGFAGMKFGTTQKFGKIPEIANGEVIGIKRKKHEDLETMQSVSSPVALLPHLKGFSNPL